MADDAPEAGAEQQGPRHATRFRTHTCGGLRPEDVGDTPVKLAGFIEEKPEGGLMLRDAWGSTLLQVAEGALPYVADRFERVALQAVVQVKGKVAERADKDEDSPSGGVQVMVETIDFLSDAGELPEGVLGDEKVELEKRLEFRQLYLRRKDVQERLAKRSKTTFQTREYLLDSGFLEIETPHLFWYDNVALDPEQVLVGDGKSFALPCGPVVLNQYVKAGQFDRYFQFQRITRREDDPGPYHQPEFTGLDLNMSYCDVDDFVKLVDGLLAHLYKEVLDVELEIPSQRMSHKEALEKYGFDKPDMRFECFVGDGGGGKTFTVPGKGDKLAEAEEVIKDIKVEGATLKVEASGSDLVVTATGKRPEVTGEAAGKARNALGIKLELVDKDKHIPVWIDKYPFMTIDKEVDEWVPGVVVFTRPVDDDEDMEIVMKNDAERRHLARARAFDLVLDGVEIASAYIGNHNQELQRWCWRHVFQQDTEDFVRLRAPIESHRFGIPPHGGMVIGFDRLVAGMLGVETIDEVMTFPKTSECEDPMLGAPGPVPAEVAEPLVEDAPPPEYTMETMMSEILEGEKGTEGSGND